jgi:hypothetical protein
MIWSPSASVVAGSASLTGSSASLPNQPQPASSNAAPATTIRQGMRSASDIGAS